MTAGSANELARVSLRYTARKMQANTQTNQMRACKAGLVPKTPNPPLENTIVKCINQPILYKYNDLHSLVNLRGMHKNDGGGLQRRKSAREICFIFT